MNRFRGGLVFKAHRLVYYSTLDLRVIKKKKKVWGVGFKVSLGHRLRWDSSGFRFGVWGLMVEGLGISVHI